MKTITVIVSPKNQSRENADPRLAFWDSVATQARVMKDYEWSLAAYAIEHEQRLKNQRCCIAR